MIKLFLGFSLIIVVTAHRCGESGESKLCHEVLDNQDKLDKWLEDDLILQGGKLLYADCRWIGEAPACQGDCEYSESRSRKNVKKWNEVGKHGYGNGNYCSTGWKRYCCRENSLAGDPQQNLGKHCNAACHYKAGYCPQFCGDRGLCCRKGVVENECDGTIGIKSDGHFCSPADEKIKELKAKWAQEDTLW